MSCNFSNLKMKGANFQGCRLKECYFTETHLSEANFQECSLEGSFFHQCDLTKADFRGAEHYRIDPQTNKIRKARFSLPEAVSLLHHFDIRLD